MTGADIKIKELEADGWMYDHEALVNRYKSAGSVSEMRNRGGYAYCRVHHGKSVGAYSWQITTVLRKAI